MAEEGLDSLPIAVGTQAQRLEAHGKTGACKLQQALQMVSASQGLQQQVKCTGSESCQTLCCVFALGCHGV